MTPDQAAFIWNMISYQRGAQGVSPLEALIEFEMGWRHLPRLYEAPSSDTELAQQIPSFLRAWADECDRFIARQAEAQKGQPKHKSPKNIKTSVHQDDEGNPL